MVMAHSGGGGSLNNTVHKIINKSPVDGAPPTPAPSSSFSIGGQKNGERKSPNSERRVLTEQFTRLDAESKYLLQTGLERLKEYKARDKMDSITQEEEETFIELLSSLRTIHTEMKNMASDMSTAQLSNILSPRIVDQIKTWNMIVDGLQQTLRHLQMNFQQLLQLKRREDLLSLSRSPFEENSRSRRRLRGAADISSDVTDSLLHSRQLLLETVQQSSGTLDILTQSSGNVTNTLDDLRDQHTVIGYSKKLLGKYGRRECTDKILILLAIIFFFSVVLYVTQRRLF